MTIVTRSSSVYYLLRFTSDHLPVEGQEPCVSKINRKFSKKVDQIWKKTIIFTYTHVYVCV